MDGFQKNTGTHHLHEDCMLHSLFFHLKEFNHDHLLSTLPV